MELHRLDGLDATGIDSTDIQDTPIYMNGVVENPDIAYEILNEHGDVILYADVDENIYEVNGLSGFFKKIGRGLKKFVKKVGKKIIRPVVRTFNRFLNPATILLRNGFLLAMKVDMMKVARKLRFGYLSEAQARKMGVDMRKFHRLRKIVSRAERIYRAAGGKSKNLRKAILRGKGNKDRKVALSGFDLGNLDEPTFYNDPFEKFVIESDVDTIEAFLNDELQVDGLGAVASAPAMAAASGAVAGVAALLSKVGNIFGKANEVKQQAQTLFQRPNRLPPRQSPIRFGPPPPRRTLPRVPRTRFTPSIIRRNQSVTSSSKNNDTEKKSFFEKNKTLLLIGGLAVVGTGVAIAVNSNKRRTARPVSGVPKKRKTSGRDALGRFTKGHRSSKRKTSQRKAPEKLVPKALL